MRGGWGVVMFCATLRTKAGPRGIVIGRPERLRRRGHGARQTLDAASNSRFDTPPLLMSKERPKDGVRNRKARATTADGNVATLPGARAAR
jgi:hypothetical protein